MIDMIIPKMKKLKPLPQPVVTWPWSSRTHPRIVNDPALMFEMSRVLRVASLSIRWATKAVLEKYAALTPESYAVHWNPYHDAFRAGGNSYKRWTREEVSGPITPKDQQYWMFFWNKCRAVREALGRGPYIVVLDHEIAPIKGGEANRDRRLNVFYSIAKSAFGGSDVVWYNHGQWTDNPPRNWDSLKGVRGDLPNCSNYYNAYSWENRGRFGQTAANNEGDIGVWLSIGGEYERYPYTPKKQPKKSANVIGTQQLGEAWYLGYHYLSDYARNVSTIDGPVSRARVFLWPEPLRPHKNGSSTDEHFLKFCEGAHNMRMAARRAVGGDG